MPGKRECLRFLVDQPERIVLQYPQGIRKPSLYGDGFQVFFSLQDGRGMYLEESAAQKITAAGIEPGQEFWLCKRRAAGSGKHHRTLWDLYLEDPTPRREESKLERDLRLSLVHAERKQQLAAAQPEQSSTEAEQLDQQTPENRTVEISTRRKPAARETAPVWKDRLLSQTNDLTDVYAAAVKHATEQHGGIVKNDDVRTIMISAFIGLQQRGRTA